MFRRSASTIFRSIIHVLFWLRTKSKAGPEELLKKHIELEDFFKEGDSYKEQLERNKKRLENIQGNLKTVKARAKNYEKGKDVVSKSIF
uniref:Uncharacterized protein n=1 Tax=Ditylenchus dipsaci TaxID=166011 RepID=A0A915D5C3_9BILA